MSDDPAKLRIVIAEVIDGGVLVLFDDGFYAFLSAGLVLSVFTQEDPRLLEGLTIQ